MTQDYVFGYGSLIERESRTRTNPRAEVVAPVIVQNLARGWWIHGKSVGFSTCFLGVRTEAGAQCNGVIYPVTPTELEALKRREKSYEPMQISPENLTLLDGREALPDDARVWTFVVPRQLCALANPQYPIVQSYVDICINGCFEIEAMYPLAKNYVDMFISETRDWSHYWENDRLYPRRPLVFVPRALQIDAVLKHHLPDLFSQIQLQPARWEA